MSNIRAPTQSQEKLKSYEGGLRVSTPWDPGSLRFCFVPAAHTGQTLAPDGKLARWMRSQGKGLGRFEVAIGTEQGQLGLLEQKFSHIK